MYVSNNKCIRIIHTKLDEEITFKKKRENVNRNPAFPKNAY